MRSSIALKVAKAITLFGFACFVVGVYSSYKYWDIYDSYNSLCNYTSIDCVPEFVGGHVGARHTVVIKPIMSTTGAKCVGEWRATMTAAACELSQGDRLTYQGTQYRAVDVCQLNDCHWDGGARARTLNDISGTILLSFLGAFCMILFAAPVWMAEATLAGQKINGKYQV